MNVRLKMRALTCQAAQKTLLDGETPPFWSLEGSHGDQILILSERAHRPTISQKMFAANLLLSFTVCSHIDLVNRQ